MSFLQAEGAFNVRYSTITFSVKIQMVFPKKIHITGYRFKFRGIKTTLLLKDGSTFFLTQEIFTCCVNSLTATARGQRTVACSFPAAAAASFSSDQSKVALVHRSEKLTRCAGAVDDRHFPNERCREKLIELVWRVYGIIFYILNIHCSAKHGQDGTRRK